MKNILKNMPEKTKLFVSVIICTMFFSFITSIIVIRTVKVCGKGLHSDTVSIDEENNSEEKDNLPDEKNKDNVIVGENLSPTIQPSVTISYISETTISLVSSNENETQKITIAPTLTPTPRPTKSPELSITGIKNTPVAITSPTIIPTQKAKYPTIPNIIKVEKSINEKKLFVICSESKSDVFIKEYYLKYTYYDEKGNIVEQPKVIINSFPFFSTVNFIINDLRKDCNIYIEVWAKDIEGKESDRCIYEYNGERG